MEDPEDVFPVPFFKKGRQMLCKEANNSVQENES
jgi:hypothetical protein